MNVGVEEVILVFDNQPVADSLLSEDICTFLQPPKVIGGGSFVGEQNKLQSSRMKRSHKIYYIQNSSIYGFNRLKRPIEKQYTYVLFQFQISV